MGENDFTNKFQFLLKENQILKSTRCGRISEGELRDTFPLRG